MKSDAKSAQPVEPEGAVLHRLRQGTAIACLLAGKSDTAQIVVIKREETIRLRFRAQPNHKFFEGGPRRRQRHLLLQNEIEQRAEPGRTAPDGRRAIGIDHTGQIVIGATYLFDGNLIAGLGQDFIYLGAQRCMPRRMST